MSNLIDLKKKVGIVLEKRNVPTNIMAQVGCAFDITGSMQGLYKSGAVQALAERLLAVALRFDDNGSLDSWSFCTEADELPPITEKNYSTYVNESMIKNNSITKWQGTAYAPAFEQIARFYFGETVLTEKSASGFFGKFFSKTPELVTTAGQNDGKMPVYIMFITDGENYDEAKTWDQLEKMKDKNVYIEFVGIGNSQFKFCQEAADKYGNVGFVQIMNLEKTSDEQLYTELLNEEFCGWIKK
jgi:hypothetical protein